MIDLLDVIIAVAIAVAVALIIIMTIGNRPISISFNRLIFIIE